MTVVVLAKVSVAETAKLDEGVTVKKEELAVAVALMEKDAEPVATDEEAPDAKELDADPEADAEIEVNYEVKSGRCKQRNRQAVWVDIPRWRRCSQIDASPQEEPTPQL